MSVGKIKAIIKRPDEEFGHVTNISPSLENLQNTVDGYIETVTIHGVPGNDTNDDVVIICNEEGRLKGMPENCCIDGIEFVGTIAVVGAGYEDFVDCPISFDTWKNLVRLGRV